VPPKISHDVIVGAALDLLKKEGIEGLTIRNLSRRLKIKAPAIYWRFSEKRDLMDAVAEEILRRHFSGLRTLERPSTNSWQPWLKVTLNRLRDAMLAYPDGSKLIAGARPHLAPTLARIAECSLETLERSGLRLAEASAVVFTALHYTYGHVIEEQCGPSPTALTEAPAAPILANFPTIRRLVHSRNKKQLDPKYIFNRGLDLIINGASVS
jgi:TetR/AcrR family transcriptional regulator, tetracycline repressor protein